MKPNKLQRSFLESKYLVWFSCGAASAVTAKLAVEQLKDKPVEVIYCNTFRYEHPDNTRFFRDVQNWLGQKITVIQSEKYKDIYDVSERTNYLNGQNGARCTTELKKVPRLNYQVADDVHVFGYTSEEKTRVKEFEQNNPELYVRWLLIENGISRNDCYQIITDAGIRMPMMYQLGYKNNNCIGCVKGGTGYWNKIRVDFPKMFNKMALQERRLNFALNTIIEKGVERKFFLDELPPNVGRYKSETTVECGVFCQPKEELNCQKPHSKESE
jgi:3'-phosphoadenosine 5'-phosphosulfate sulfotransferase (PAPS reductase)/FAD synthetase